MRDSNDIRAKRSTDDYLKKLQALQNTPSSLAESATQKLGASAVVGTSVPTTTAGVNYSQAITGNATPSVDQISTGVPASDTQKSVALLAQEDAYKKANTDYLSSLMSAENSYRSAIDARGAQAEYLNSMGVGNSGYSNYLTDRAYAAKVDAEIAAGAAKASAENAADLQYADNLRQMARNEAAMYEAAGNVAGQVSAMVKAGDLSQGDASQMMINLYSKQIEDGTANMKEIEQAHKSGLMDDDTYNNIIHEANEDTTPDALFVNEDGTYLSLSDANKVLESAKAWMTPENYSKLEETFQKKYTAVQDKTGISFRKDGGFDNPGKAGNNFSVIGDEGTVYYVQYAGGEAPSNVSEASKDMKDGAVFMLDGEIYVKQDGKCYQLEARANSSTSYNSLKRRLEGNMTKKDLRNVKIATAVKPGSENVQGAVEGYGHALGTAALGGPLGLIGAGIGNMFNTGRFVYGALENAKALRTGETKRSYEEFLKQQGYK